MHVLVGVGAPDDSLTALERAVDRAAAAGDRLTVAVLAADRSPSAREALTDDVEAVLASAAVDATVRHVEGDAGSQLVDIAESESFDEIVIGGGTTSPMGKIKIDATAEFVLLNAHTTVTLVR
jgi:nucleotide-binding universal stress UspA family protein